MVNQESYVDGMAVQFKEVWKNLDVSNDDFIQTSEQRHKLGCQQFVQRVYDAGDIYKSSYEGMYCEGCEDFKTERDLVDGKCPDHSTRPIKHLREENYFFALSKSKSFLRVGKKVKLINLLIKQSNDLQDSVVKIYPEIKKIIDYIKSQQGCYFSRITGSGSACIGIFSNMKNAICAQKLIKLKYPKCWCVVSKTI